MPGSLKGGGRVNILVIDIGGTSVKVWKTGERDCTEVPSGPTCTPQVLVNHVKSAAAGWHFDRISMGYPGIVHHGRPAQEPFNLGAGWLEFDWPEAFGCPIRIMNDACLQALGSYEAGCMLYLGLGTDIGTALVYDGKIVPLALGHLQFRDATFSTCLSREGLQQHGNAVWQAAVRDAGAQLKAAFLADYVVFGGGNAKNVEDLPEGCRKGGNHNAYFGGLRIWDEGKFKADDAG